MNAKIKSISNLSTKSIILKSSSWLNSLICRQRISKLLRSLAILFNSSFNSLSINDNSLFLTLDCDNKTELKSFSIYIQNINELLLEYKI